MVLRLSFIDQRGSSVGGRRASSHASREILAMQALLADSDSFNSSLGCPLTSYEEATMALVGGKALQCWRLMKHGLPVPPAFIIPTYVYSLHIDQAGVQSIVNEVFSSDLRDDAVREAVRPKLEEIRNKIMEAPLHEEVVQNLGEFLDVLPESATVAVRSSGSAEDLASQSFAGQYDTYLYKQTIDEVSESVKACWASMFKSHILDYFAKSSSDTKTEVDANTFKMNPPQMGVLIMQMVNAKAAGVCFSKNLWGDANEIMIEAVPGQGEGLVSGEVTPDRYVVDKNTGKLVYQEINAQVHKFVKAANADGITKIELEPPFTAPVLSPRNLKALNLLANTIERFYNHAQDIEWAIDELGHLVVLQSRPITTEGGLKNLTFIPPGEGFWQYDPIHMPRPMSPWFQETYSLGYALGNSRRTGCLMKDMRFRYIHGFAYTQPEFVPPSEALERAAEAYWKKKLYEDDYREFIDFFRPECEEKQEELRRVNPSSLSYKALRSYVAHCYDMAVEFWKLHHTYTFPAVIVVGDFMNRMAALTDKDAMETLQLLEAASPESRGIMNRKDPLLERMYSMFASNEKAMKLLQHEDSAWAMDCLLHMPDGFGEIMREVKLKYGWRLAGGYDLVSPAIIETPSFFLKSIYIGTQSDPQQLSKSEEKVRKLADEWKAAISPDKHDEFEEVLEVGQRFFRLRDERGLATDLSGIGLCRRGILEGGRRLKSQGIIFEEEHLCVATKSEAMSLLQGDFGLLSEKNSKQLGPLEVPTAQELKRRFEYIKTADCKLVPRTLGIPPNHSPDPSAFPPSIRRTMGAVFTSLLRGINDEGQVDEAIKKSPDKVKGLAASMGIVTGPVCLVLTDQDLQKVKKGDIVVTYSCSASFNIVLALCAGICTDYGGMLSHAAIVAREGGIPAVVGSQNATTKFKDGDIVKIDSSTATVSLVSSNE